MYEIAFGLGCCTAPFYLYTMMPRKLITYDSKLDDDNTALTLAMEEDEDAPDPLDYLDTSKVIIIVIFI